MRGIRTGICLALLLTALVCGGEATADEPLRPNFVVILCDDLGYGDLACFGHPTIKTPNLDRLATEGIRFTDCYSASPVCSASRAGLLTGRTPSRVGVYDWIPAGHAMHLKASERTIATLLKDAGYATCHVGKWHLNGKFNSPAQPQPGDHGFEHWMSTQNNAAPSHENPTNFVRNGQPIGKQDGYSCQIVVREAIDWLANRRDKEKPFFQFVCFHEPHEPIASPPELVASYPDAKEKGQALYCANVTNMDRAVGELMRALDDLKLRDNTLVFFTSDNGPETLNRYPNAWRSHGSPGPLRGMKLWLYEGGIRVPGILRWPSAVKPGQTIKEPICSLDLLPTFCALAGATVPTDRPLDGQNITALLRGEPFRREQPLFWHYLRALGGNQVALRDGNIVLLGRTDTKSDKQSEEASGFATIKSARLTELEAFDLAKDLNQSQNLLPASAQQLEGQIEKLTTKYQQVQQEGPTWNSKP